MERFDFLIVTFCADYKIEFCFYVEFAVFFSEILLEYFTLMVFKFFCNQKKYLYNKLISTLILQLYFDSNFV